jgi:hypothetical protein
LAFSLPGFCSPSASFSSFSASSMALSPSSFLAVLPRADTSSTALPTSYLVALLNFENLSTYCSPMPPGKSFITL